MELKRYEVFFRFVSFFLLASFLYVQSGFSLFEFILFFSRASYKRQIRMRCSRWWFNYFNANRFNSVRMLGWGRYGPSPCTGDFGSWFLIIVLSCCGFSKILYFLVRILMEHIERKNSLDSKLQIYSICSNKVRSRN